MSFGVFEISFKAFEVGFWKGIHSVWKITVWSITVNGLKYLRFWGK